MNRVVSLPSIFTQFRGSVRMNKFRKRQLGKEDSDNGDERPSGKRIKLVVGTNPVIGGKVVKVLELNKNRQGAGGGAKLPLELLPKEVWQQILEDVDDPREFFDLFQTSSQFRTIISPRSLRFAVDFDHSSDAEEVMWGIVLLIGKLSGSSVWNLEISFGDFSFDFYAHLVQCLGLMPNLKSLRLRLSPVGKVRTSKLIGPQSHGNYLDYSWNFEEMWQYIEDHPVPRLPQLTHLDLDVNEDTLDFLSAAIIPAYARQITKFETRILLCLRYTHSLISLTGLFKNVTELHLKQIQSIGQLDEVLTHLERPNPPLNDLCLYLTQPVNAFDLLELLEPLQVKTLRVIESEKGAILYELCPFHFNIRMDELLPIVSTIENLELKDSPHLRYDFLQYCKNLKCLTVLKNKSCKKFIAKSVANKDKISYQLRRCVYKSLPKNTKIWAMIPSLAKLQIKSFDNELMETFTRKTN